MRLRILTLSVLFSLVLAAPAAAREADPTDVESGLAVTVATPLRQGLTLRQAEQRALSGNLNLVAEIFRTRASQALVERGFGVYDPTLELDLSGGQRNQISSLTLTEPIETDFFRLDSSLAQKFSTGADLALSFSNAREEITATGLTPVAEEYYNSKLAVSLTQPLLQGFGPTVTEQEILLSVKDREAQVQNLRDQVFNLLAGVRNAYYEALRARDDLAFRRASVRVAEQVLKENRARVEVGVLPKVEVLEAEFGLKSRQRDLLDAERAYRNALDRLALLLNSDEVLEPSMELGQPAIALDPESGYEEALLKRPDVQRRLRELDRLALERVLSEDQLKPTLDLRAGYSHQGLGDGFGSAVGELGNDDLRGWELGLNFSYPLGNRTARSDLQRNRVLLKSKQAEIEQLKAEVLTEIRLAIRQVEVADSKIAVSRSERSLAAEKLEILLGRKDVGLATTRDVLEGEADLASAKSGLASALADYNNAVTEYLQVTGQLLDHERVRFAGDLQPGDDGAVFSLD